MPNLKPKKQLFELTETRDSQFKLKTGVNDGTEHWKWLVIQYGYQYASFENTITILRTGRQDGKTDLMIILTRIDDVNELLYQRLVGRGETRQKIEEVVNSLFWSWGHR